MPTAVIMPKFEMTQETGKVVAAAEERGRSGRRRAKRSWRSRPIRSTRGGSTGDGHPRGISARPGEVVPIAADCLHRETRRDTGNGFPAGKPAVTPTAAPAARSSASPRRPRWPPGWPRATRAGPQQRHRNRPLDASREDVKTALAHSAQGGATQRTGWPGMEKCGPCPRPASLAGWASISRRCKDRAGRTHPDPDDVVAAAAPRQAPSIQHPASSLNLPLKSHRFAPTNG